MLRKTNLLLAAILLVAAVLVAQVWAANELFTTTKSVLVCGPLLKDNGAATVTYADTAGFNRATFLLAVGATDITLDAKLTECATSGGNYADITGAAVTQITALGDDKVYAIEVSMRGSRLRYLKPVITVGDGTLGANVCGVILLRGGHDSLYNAAAAGLAELVKVE